MKKFLCIILLCLASLYINAQDYLYKLGFSGIVDNREYFNNIQYPQSILGVRAHGSLGMLLDSAHYFNAGITYMYEYGGKPGAIDPWPTIYYHGKNNWIDVYAGTFPRQHLLNYPQ